MRPVLAALLLVSPLSGCTVCTLSSDETPARTPHSPADSGAGWTALLHGATLEGWTQRGGSASYSVEDGTIVGESRPNTGNSFLCTTRDYDDFILELEVNCDAELNSGIQIRSRSSPDYNNGEVYGYQIEIDPTPRAFSGGIYDEGNRGWLAQPTPAQARATPYRIGEWNHYRIEARGPRIRTWINGVPIADLQDGLVTSGFIALQVHGVGERTDPLRVRWRNVRIRPTAP